VVKDNFFFTSIKEYFPQAEGILDFFVGLEQMGMNFILHSNLIPFILFLVYFTLLYKWLFQKKITLKGSVFGSLFFVFGAIFVKFLGSLYFSFVKKGLLQNYGEYYTFIIAFLWIFFVMCCFYYGSCISLAWERINKSYNR
jgi:membrane protein